MTRYIKLGFVTIGDTYIFGKGNGPSIVQCSVIIDQIKVWTGFWLLYLLWRSDGLMKVEAVGNLLIQTEMMMVPSIIVFVNCPEQVQLQLKTRNFAKLADSPSKNCKYTYQPWQGNLSDFDNH